MVKYCSACGEQLPFETADRCPECGVRIPSPPVLKPKKSEGRRLSPYLIMGIVLIFGFIITAAVFYYIGSGVAFFGTHKSSDSTPSDTSGISPSIQVTHTPSEIFQGHLNSNEDYSVTTNLRDPQTSRYTIRLHGPEGADWGLYVKKEGSSYNFDYSSVNRKSNKQIDIIDPEIGNYTVLIHSFSSAGDFILYIDYEYKSMNRD